MKSRRVVVTLEMETRLPLRELRVRLRRLRLLTTDVVHQVQANVIKPGTKTKGPTKASPGGRGS